MNCGRTSGASSFRQEQLIAAFKGAPSIDYEELRADIDRYVDQDPTPRYWVELKIEV